MGNAFRVNDRVLINTSAKAKELSFLEQIEITVTFVEDGFLEGIADNGRTYSNISFDNAKLIRKCT